MQKSIKFVTFIFIVCGLVAGSIIHVYSLNASIESKLDKYVTQREMQYVIDRLDRIECKIDQLIRK